MKFLLTSDWHLRERRPRARLDKNFFATQEEKVDSILSIASEYLAIILNAGDFFNTNPPTEFVKQWIINKLKEWQDPPYPPMCVVFGQHDLLHHSLKNTDRTGLAVLEAAEVVQILGSESVVFGRGNKKEVHVYGVHWGSEVPKVRPEKNKINILVIHRMMVREKLWSGQGNYTYAKAFLRKHKAFDLIVSGDNHQHFVITDGKRKLVNCGSMMRTTAKQFDHKPCVGLWDSKTFKLEMLDIPCEPVDEVLSRKHLEEVEERNERLEAFVSGLKDDYSVDLNFRDNLGAFFAKNKIRQVVKDLIWENM